MGSNRLGDKVVRGLLGMTILQRRQREFHNTFTRSAFSDIMNVAEHSILSVKPWNPALFDGKKGHNEKSMHYRIPA